MAKVKETYHMAPFSQEVGTEGKFVSFYTQREAQYKDAPDSVFNYKKLPQNELEIQSYKDIIVAPSPSIKEVDGFKSEEEVTPTEEPSEEPSDNPPIPTISGTSPFTTSTQVTISVPNDWINGAPGREVRYTTDGSEPSENSLYSPLTFTISETTTIKARAYDSLYDNFGDVATKVFTKLEE